MHSSKVREEMLEAISILSARGPMDNPGNDSILTGSTCSYNEKGAHG
jgi:hypothetical protein